MMLDRVQYSRDIKECGLYLWAGWNTRQLLADSFHEERENFSGHPLRAGLAVFQVSHVVQHNKGMEGSVALNKNKDTYVVGDVNRAALYVEIK